MKLLVTKMSKMSIWFICSLIAYIYIYIYIYIYVYVYILYRENTKSGKSNIPKINLEAKSIAK